MREIKFKCWIKESDEEVYRMTEPVDALEMCLGGMEVIDLMQYTGLKDKNGKEVYEGDILDDDSKNPFKINEMQDAQFTWKMLKENVSGIFPSDCEYEECKIIGNIYENPELLS